MFFSPSLRRGGGGGWPGAAPGRIVRPDSRAGRGGPAFGPASARSRHTWPAGSLRPGACPGLEGPVSGWSAPGSGTPLGEACRREPWSRAQGPQQERGRPRPGPAAAAAAPCAACSVASCWRWAAVPVPRTRHPGPSRVPAMATATVKGALPAPHPGLQPLPRAPARSARPDPSPSSPPATGRGRPARRA